MFWNLTPNQHLFYGFHVFLHPCGLPARKCVLNTFSFRYSKIAKLGWSRKFRASRKRFSPRGAADDLKSGPNLEKIKTTNFTSMIYDQTIFQWNLAQIKHFSPIASESVLASFNSKCSSRLLYAYSNDSNAYQKHLLENTGARNSLDPRYWWYWWYWCYCFVNGNAAKTLEIGGNEGNKEQSWTHAGTNTGKLNKLLETAGIVRNWKE